MKHLIVITILFSALTSFGQSEMEVLRLLDTYKFISGEEAPPPSDMYPGEGMQVLDGSFLLNDRSEHLCLVPLEKGRKKSNIAFVAFQDEQGDWQRSAWFSLGYQNMGVTDLEGDDFHELTVEVELLGRKMTKKTYRIISLEGDEITELYKIEGFSLHEDARMLAREGEQMASNYKVTIADLDENGSQEITEEVFDEFFGYEDLNENGTFEAGNQMALPSPKFKQTIYEIKKGELTIVEIKDIE